MSEKRLRFDNNNNDNDNDDDDDYGPMPNISSISDNNDNNDNHQKKKMKYLEYENIYLDNLPNSNSYEKSYMHRDIVTHITVSKVTEFIITGSYDGHVKFWKKMPNSIEFVKHYHAHLGPICSFILSFDEQKLVTTCIHDSMIKIFDVVSFDMSNMISAKHIPTAAVWLNGNSFSKRIAVADGNSGIIRIYQSEGKQEPIHEVTFHSTPVKYMALNVLANTIISSDMKGVLEYWDVDTYELPNNRIKFSYKSETDLYEHAKSGTIPYCISISPKGTRFATFSKDKQIRVFDFETGKLRKKYDESSSVYTSGAQTVKSLDSLEIGRRAALERELESLPETLALCNLTFDESGNFLIYGSLSGIKILNLYTNRVSRTIGTSESGERFLAVALYQGVPVVDTQYLLSKKNNSDQILTAAQLHVNPSPDPTIFCTSFKKRRFYCFSKREPDESEEIRDVLNEKPTEEERQTIIAPIKTKEHLAKEMVLRTTLGDIHVKLFADDVPKTVENFVTHSKNGYYNNVIFHRVIKGFMIQTGDPLGNGTGGESIWGGEFKDEFVKTLKHDKPYTLSMANSGPNSNGSQFFITTVPTPWLDNKHTVFGRVTSGYEVVSKIENIKVNKLDKPYDDIKILQIDVINN